jgi:hypothetical protein
VKGRDSTSAYGPAGLRAERLIRPILTEAGIMGLRLSVGVWGTAGATRYVLSALRTPPQQYAPRTEPAQGDNG